MTTTTYVINKVSMKYNENLCLFIVEIFFTSSYVFVIESLYQQIGVITLKKTVELSFFYNLNFINDFISSIYVSDGTKSSNRKSRLT